MLEEEKEVIKLERTRMDEVQLAAAAEKAKMQAEITDLLEDMQGKGLVAAEEKANHEKIRQAWEKEMEEVCRPR